MSMNMNGFSNHDLDEDAFGENTALSGLKSFDAFPKTKSTYTERTTSGGYLTVVLFSVCLILTIFESITWISGTETQVFSVEKGISHSLQINFDAIFAMQCSDIHINVQDASGDRILAGELLHKDPTVWNYWVGGSGRRRRMNRHRPNSPMNHGRGLTEQDKEMMTPEEANRLAQEAQDTHAEHVLGEVKRGTRRFRRTPRIKGQVNDACRVFGSLEGNKVQGDFHITARGHGYQEFGAKHLDHTSFNFSHIITELSFGPHYPSLLNPLDDTIASTEEHFQKYQYYISIVPTIYTSGKPRNKLPRGADLLHIDNVQLAHLVHPRAVVTNQYAVTQSEVAVPESGIPGIFFKYDIEPILLTVQSQRGSMLGTGVKIVNLVSGILVGGAWVLRLWDVIGENWGRKNRRVDGWIHGGGS